MVATVKSPVISIVAAAVLGGAAEVNWVKIDAVISSSSSSCLLGIP